MVKNTSKQTTFSPPDLLEEEITRLGNENPDSLMLHYLRTQANASRRQQGQKVGLEKCWQNPWV